MKAYWITVFICAGLASSACQISSSGGVKTSGGITTSGTPTQGTPAFSPTQGTYSGTQSVVITSAGADTIYYTTDGSAPNSTLNSFASPPSLASTRNDFTGVSGYSFTVTQAISVSQLGRGYAAGNASNHVVKLWNNNDHVTPLASATVLAASASDANGFKWASITPVTLSAGNTYAIASDETSAGDGWLNGFTPTLQPLFGSVTQAFSIGGNGVYPSTAGTANLIYNSPGMIYSSTLTYSGPISVASSQPLRAQAVKAGSSDSAVAEADYSINVPITKANAYGDSITIGFGLASPSTENWAAVFTATKPLTLLNNFAISGSNMGDPGEIPQAYFHGTSLYSAPVDTAQIILIGSNALTEAATSSNIPVIEDGFRAFAVWLGLPYFRKVTAASGITFAGTWTPFYASDANSFNMYGQASSTTNDTATGTVVGTTVYVAGRVNSSNTRTIDILVDGVSQGTHILTDALLTTSATAYPYCIRVSGLSATSHTVQVKLTSTGAGAVVVQWMGGNGTSAQLPKVGIGNTIPRGTDNVLASALNAATLPMVNELIADGLNVVYVDDNSVMTPNDGTEYQSGGIHPTAAGAVLIANKWVATF